MIPDKVLVTDSVHLSLISEFTDRGWEVVYTPAIPYAEVLSTIHEYGGLIINSKINCNKDFIDRAVKLKFIARLGSGREVIDIPYAKSKGIQVYFSPEGNKNAVAEHALGMLLSLSNQLTRADAEVRQKTWNREARRGWEIAGKTIGIIGFGHTGSQFARKLSGLEVEVLAYDKYLNKGYANEYKYVNEVNINDLIKKSHIISFHLPWSPDTYHFADKSFFENCNAGTIIVNTSRGNVVDTNALVECLESSHLGGACLDVFENEKPYTFTDEEERLYQRLYAIKNLVLSPHIAGWTVESKYLLAKILLDKIFS